VKNDNAIRTSAPAEVRISLGIYTLQPQYKAVFGRYRSLVL